MTVDPTAPLPDDLAGQTFTFQRDTYDPEELAERFRRALAEGRYVLVFDDGVYVPPADDEGSAPK